MLRNVFLVPNIAKNILSVSQMFENDSGVTFKDKRCIIHDKSRRKIADIGMVKKSFCLHLEICKRPITTTTDPKASEEVCIQGAGYVEVSKLQSWKIEEAVNGERQRKTDSNKDKTDIKKIKEVDQGTRMKNLVIKEDTNQRKESVFEK